MEVQKMMNLRTKKIPPVSYGLDSSQLGKSFATEKFASLS
jgi:hypothetical protein